MNYRRFSILISLTAITAVIFFGTKTASASGLVKAPNNLGLASYWSFEDAAGTSVTDFSGNGITGTFGGSPTWIKGKFGNALQFVAASQSVSNSSFVAPTTAITVSVWVYGNNFSTFDPSGLVSKATGYNATDGFSLFTGYSNWSDISFSINGNLATSAASTLSNNRWYHIVGTYDKVSIKVYVDGVVKASTAYSADIATNSEPLRVSNWSSFQSFRADDLRIYNRALGATEISYLYNNAGIRRTNASLNTFLTNGLVGLWSFDGADISGTTVYDRSSSGNNGTLNNSPLPIKGKIGQGLDFSGTNYVTLGSSLNQAGGSYSVSTWIKPSNLVGCSNGLGDFCGILNAVGAGTNDFWFGITSSGKLEWAIVGPSSNSYQRVDTGSGGTQIVAGTWYHLVIVYNSSGPTYAIYLNAVSQPLQSGVAGSAAGGTKIGAELAGNSTYSFRGIIDDMRMYNRALSAAEVGLLYRAGQVQQSSSISGISNGLVLWHTFDGPRLNSTTSTDSSGQGNNAALSGAPPTTKGKVGQALTFSSGKSLVLTTSAFDLSSSSFSISAWFKTVSSGSNLGIYTKTGSSSRIKIYQIGGSTLRFRLVNSVGSGVSIDSSGVSINDGAWHQVTATFDYNTGAAAVYIDGISRGAGTGPSGDLDAVPSVHLIGQGDGGSSESWDGDLDDIRVYNRALSASEVKRLYDSTK
jgi:hypothetical protein